jgi:allantoicase
MTQHLHIVFGGELVTPTENVFKDSDAIHIVGIFPNRKSAYDAWKNEAQRTVDNAHMRYFLGDLQKLIDDSTTAPEAQD